MSDLHTELLAVVENAIGNQPRSLQKRIGPSEIGVACDRKLGYKLLGTPDLNPNKRVPWKPFIGTAVHTAFETVFHDAAMKRPDFETTGGQYLVETRVDVGEILGETITGSCDLYVQTAAAVVDFKIIGDDQLRKYRANGPGPQYRKQAHLYGRGWQRRGMPVRTVAVWFLPRNMELRQNHLWTEPYDEQIAVDALAKAEGVATLTRALGTGALPLLAQADDWCSFCPFFQAGSQNLAEGCPGVPRTYEPSKALTSLIAP